MGDAHATSLYSSCHLTFTAIDGRMHEKRNSTDKQVGLKYRLVYIRNDTHYACL